MARFFITASNIFGGVAYMNAQDLDHIRALRIRKGESFTICDGEGNDYTCRLADDGGGARAEIISSQPSAGEPTVYCTVYAALSKGDKLESVIQKSVELGAAEIAVFPSDRCVSRPDGAALIKKTARWQKISEEAAKQSGRGRIPAVTVIPSFSAAIAQAAVADLPLFFYEDETRLGLKDALESKPSPRTVSIVTGPEGGFEPMEAQHAVDSGMLSVTMGPRILRCETAPLCALSAVMLHTGNL